MKRIRWKQKLSKIKYYRSVLNPEFIDALWKAAFKRKSMRKRFVGPATADMRGEDREGKSHFDGGGVPVDNRNAAGFSLVS